MTVPPEPAGTLSLREKQERLRAILLDKIGRTRTAPPSFAQERLWFLHRLNPGGASYNISAARRLAGALDVDALRRAIAEIVRRHEALRTTFAEADGAPVQVIAPFQGFELPVQDLPGLDEEGRRAEARRRATDDARRPFDLAAGPLFRAALLRLGDEEHVLLLCMHHVVSDGWSMGVFFRELSALYEAFTGGRESPLAEPAFQYADYAARQRKRLDARALDRELAWWRERLAGAPALLELPTDRPRPAEQSFRGGVVYTRFAAELLERLRAVARGEEATLYMVLLAAFQVLLSKYAETDDVVVGSAVAGRRDTDEEALIGFFANSLALRTDLSGDPTFRQLLRRVRDVTLDAYEHQELPFEKLVAELQPGRSLSHSPVFQVMFTLDDAPAGTRGALAGVRSEGVEAELSATKFDLTLAVGVGAGFRAAIEYSADLFDRATIERMLGHLARVLEQAAANPDTRLSAIDPADEAERRRVIDEWNRTDAPYPRGGVAHLFEEQAAATPDALAVVFEDPSLTYAALNARANRLAHHLSGRGIGLESRVGICLERGPELVVAILAVLKAGGAYVPLDPGYPAERLEHMLADASVRVLLTQDALRAALPAPSGVTVVSVDGDADAIAAERAQNPRSGAFAGSLAYVMYTSGSTGTPKGVAVEHRAIVRLVRGANYAALGPDEAVLQAAPVSFDAATLELWGALLNGGRVVLVPGANPSLEELGRVIARHGVTTMWLTAGLFQVMVDERLDELRGVRQLLAGGDVLPVEPVARVRARFPELRLINGYGPTENTTFTCCYTVPEGWRGAAVPIGTPVSNTRVYVLDRWLRAVPVGVPGELYAGGDGVARGYLNRPALTAERFVPDPFAATPGARMYRTGDRVRWTARGVIEYLGRLDAQVKVRGFRIEPGEIEAALLRHPSVAECVVAARRDAPGDRRLAAYVVAAQAEPVDPGALRAHLRASLPEYMLPGAFVALDALPLSPNGKVDRRALPAPEAAAAAEAYVAPRTPVEEVLAGIWAEVLRVERVGAHESFFELGGHSLLATRAVSRIRGVFGVELPLRALFEGPTVAQAAARVEGMRRAAQPPLPPVVPVSRAQAPPLSFAQERLWFLDRLEPGSPLYGIPAPLRLSGPLNARALERALGEIVRRHESLRTTFADVNGTPVQVVAPFAGFRLPVEDLSALAPAEREAAARRRAAAESAAPFDLAAGPLFRVALLRLAHDEHVLLLAMHHIVSDGWSIGLLFRELSALYEAYANGGQSPLAPLTVQYADFAAWQREQLRGQALEQQLAWWKARLAGAPALLELPTDRPRPAAPTHRGARVPVAFSGGLAERLERLGRREGATLYMVVLAAWQVLLGRYAGTDDVVVGSPIAGRTRGETEGVIGLFANTLALRTDLSGDPGFREVLRRVREVTLGAYEHQDVPFEKLVAELRPERSLSHSPLFQVLLSLQTGEMAGGELPGLRTRYADPGLTTTKYDLVLTLAPRAGRMAGVLEYATDLFDRATAGRMAAHLGRLLEQVAGDPDLRLSRLELAGDDERRRVLEEWAGADAPYPGECVHERIRAQAMRTPDAVAVRDGAQSLTYRELEARANRLAHHLRRLDVGPESRVAICLPRGAALVVSVLGVLKAGGAYVPLDPSHPPERLALVLSDSGARVLLAAGDAVPAAPAGVDVVRVDRLSPVDGDGDTPPAGGAEAENLALVIYTSGSTGIPKGVEVPHRGLASYLAWFDRAVLGDEGFALPTVSRPSFDAHVRQLYPPLLRGDAVWVIDDATAAEPKALLAALGARAGRVSFGGVPSLWNAMVDLVRAGDAPRPEGLVAVLLGGEALAAELAERTFALFPGVALWNHYGPTEATVNTSVARVRPGEPVTIGRPVANARVYLLDRGLRPQPVGVPGELYVGGAGVARGYLGRPGLTAERFVPDPFSSTPGARMYRTGDRARWRADGQLQYAGRVDQQVKVRGFRIEPGEIESVLRREPGVRECAVVAREDAPGQARLVAYLAGDARVEALRAALRRSLPDYMVPGAFVVLEQLPTTSSGKLDRRALPAPELAPDEDRYAAPRTPVQEVLAGIWGDVLGHERVGVDDNFFELGGHSLLATVVVGLVREAFAIELPLRALFEGPTIAELAERVEALRRAGLPPLPPVLPVDRRRALPLSFAQERLWFLDRLEPGNPFYNVATVLRLEGPLDAPALERALAEIVRRHEALRTVFREVDGVPVQVIAPAGRFGLAVDDLSTLPEAEREAGARRRAAEAAAQPFHLGEGPLFRARLLRLGSEAHVLLLSQHHVVTDWWSTGLLLRELAALYDAFRDGRPSPLRELAVQYADHAVWQREQLRGPVLEGQVAWWKERLAGAPAVMELPADRPRPAVQSYRGARAPLQLSAAASDALRALGQREGATLYMVLLGAFQLFLGRYAGTDDVVVGTPVAGRTRREVEGLIGFFVNTLALRTDLSGDPDFREVLRRVREVTLGAWDHQDVPFEKLVEELQPERSLAHSPLFQVMFTLGRADQVAAALPGVRMRLEAAANASAKFDLNLGLSDDSGGVRGFLEYSTDLFDRATAERMAGHLARVLEQVAADPGVRVSALAPAGPDERRLVLEEWNRTGAPYPADACIHHLVQAQARRTPGAVALTFEDRSLTYAQLNARANRLAHLLRRRGVGPEVRVGVCLERGVDLVASLLAVLKAGGAYVPLDPGYPAERLAWMLGDAAVPVLVTDQRLRGLLAAPAGASVVSLDAAEEEIAAQSGADPEGGAGPHHLAYVIYTSGSTGRPKGVMNTHGAVVNRLCWMQAEYGLHAGDVVLHKTPFSFDVSVWELFWPLQRGARLVVARPDGHRDPAYLREVVEREGVTTLHFVPSMLPPFVEAVQAGRCATLRRVVCSGEALSPARVQQFHARFPAVALHNLYGPTEAAVDVSHWTCAPEAATGVVPIGRPVWNTRLYVLDAALRPAPVGVPGELHIGGVQVARGYLNRPGLTARMFVPDPFAPVPGARLYRTGDRARWRADGTLEYLGRLDQQVKIRGFRIEPGEIEAALRRHPAVRDAAVVAREHAGETRLVAYVVGAADPEELRGQLRAGLPEHMVPAAFVALPALPLTPSGKLDRRALPAPEYADGEAYAAPRTPAEELLAGIWAQVLRVHPVGVHAGFFRLGGHSLLATRVVSRVREVFGVELPLRALFEAPTVAGLAARVEALRRAAAERPPLAPLAPADRGRPLPLSFAQERLWFLDRMEPGSPFYNLPAGLRLSGALDAEALRRALGEIVRRHEALRTTFGQADGGPVQVIAPFAGFALPVEDLSALPDAERQAALERRVRQESARPFDLAAGPLFRALLLRLGGAEHVLLLCMHHVASDGWSMGILFRELAALYEAYANGAERVLQPLPVQYADFAVWQREQLRGDALEAELAWWKERLAGAPALLELPTDRPRPAVQSYRGGREPVAFPAGLVQRLGELARREGATPYMVLLGAFQVLLARYGAGDDVVVGTPIAGRTRREVEGLIGFFVNTLALRTDLSGDPSFREVLRRVREVTLGAYEHQQVPFERLVAELQPERSLGYAPVFQVMFVLQNTERAGASFAGLRVSGVAAEMATTRYDLSLTLLEEGGGIRGELAYATDLFDAATARRMLDHLGGVLQEVADDPDVRLSRLQLAGAEERRRVVEAWSHTDAPIPQGCIHHLVEAQAARTPDAVALVLGDQAVTYRQVDQGANRLAQHLARMGVGPEARVGIYLDRSPAAVVAMLGVMKAGAAYLPLDPAYPAERLAYMLEDAGARVLVTQASLRGVLPVQGLRIVSVDEDADAVAARPARAPRTAVAPANAAYVVYTSGSTGRPKGVVVTHANAVFFLAGMDDRVGGTIPGTWLAVTRVSFDPHVLELLWTLARGFRVVIHPDGAQGEDAGFAAQIRRYGVTHLQCTPSLATMRLAESGAQALRGIERVFVGGEALAPDLAARLGEVVPGVVNLYGPTESTVWFSTHQVAGLSAPIPVGRPIANARGYVLSPALLPQPVGVPGELCVGGPGVTRGYHGRPGLTAERFVPDPFSPVPGARMYRSGDRARWRADGTLEYLGRLDQQVKIRGFRVEPGEVEGTLRRHPGVAEAAVVARRDGGETRLVAYVVGDADPDALRAHLRAGLPEYMVPAALVPLQALPLTPSGKLDRRALPAPGYGSADRYVAPRTPAEEVLAGIWAQVLRIDRVGAAESFFELGGHSLLATRVVSRVREVFGVELPLRAVFESPTVAGLAAAVEALRRAGPPRLAPVLPADRGRPLPLSFAQERLWFLDRMEPGSPFYNLPAALRLSGALDAGALERALGEVVRRHEALRTTFAEADGAPVQVIAPFAGFALPVEDLSPLPDAEREAAMLRRAGDEAARPFDLSAGPLFRATLLRLADAEHVLLLCMHHVVSDGWSLGVLLRELAALYETYANGGDGVLPPLAVQYADFAVWQREQLRGRALEAEVAWWKDRLAGAPALLELPTDRPRPAVQSYRGAQLRTKIGAQVVDGLRALARGEGATLYMVLLAAWQVLLGRYAATDDVVVGSPIAGRTRRELEGLIGFFANTLALRTDLSGDPSFREVLRRVREATLGAYEHQQVPFERLVAELQPERSLGHHPLFQVSFTLQNDEPVRGGLPGLRTRPVAAEVATAKFDLGLVLGGAGADGLRGVLQYSVDLFDRATARRMLRHLHRVLEQVAENADRAIGALALADEAERRRVVEEWNRVDAPRPAEPTLHAWFQAQAARTPDAVAVACEDDSLTYAALNAAANRLAHHLRRHGVGPEVRVGVCLERGLEMVVAILATLKAGGAYVPMDPAYPADRLAHLVGDSGVPVLVTQQAVRANLPLHPDVTIVLVDADASAIAAESPDNPESGAGPEHLAYVIYTSGSTGTPKGALIEHRNVARLFTATEGWFGFGPGDVWTLFHSYAFDFSVWELWGALLYGGRLVVVPFHVSRDPEAFHALVRREGVTVLNQTPSAFRQFIRADQARGGDLALREVILGGEALEPATLREWVARRGIDRPRLVNMYGITETTVHVTYRPLAAPDVAGGGGSPIGVRIPDLQLYVLDAGMRPLPVGVPGELYVGGAGVARGYLNRPELTAARFVHSPFGPGRLYRTGDRVRWLADGTLDYLGRLDEQVKVRGFRVEPGEIEAALLSHPAVRECAVVVREDTPGDRRIVAYVVGGADADGLRGHLRGALPEHMVPAAFVPVARIPLTGNGKLDRRALPAPEYAAGDERYVAPRTPLQEVLAEIWAQVLGVRRVGAADGFFELGGHSLLATRVVSRIREALAVELPLRALFEGPTVAELAERVEALRRAELPPAPPLVQVERDGPPPLSFAQERLWFLDRLQPGSSSYNLPAALRLQGPLDAAALRRALDAVVARHEALRTTFGEVDGAPVQVIHPPAAVPLPVEDLSPLDDDEREAQAGRRAADEAERPFDLAAGPLVRARLLRLGDDDHVFLLSMHHAVSDGWSVGVLFRELGALYRAFRNGEQGVLPPLPVQYADFAVWQRARLRGEALEQQVAWWKARLAGAPALLELPTDRPRPAEQSFAGAWERFAFSAELLERLRAVGRGQGATLFMVLLGAWQALLARYAGTGDVVVGTAVAGRARRETEGLIGFFANTLPLRTELSGDPPFREVLRRVRQAALGAYEHQEVPFEKLVAELHPQRSLSHSPLVQVMFALDHGEASAPGLAGVRARGMGADTRTTKFDLALSLSAREDGLRGALSYATALFDGATVRRMAAHLERVLEQVADDPELRLSRLRLLRDDERRAVLAWSRTADAADDAVPVHQLFAARAARTPDAEALRLDGRATSFRALDEAANRLAHHLVARGVGPESRVGVFAARTPETVAATLAVLKAGGAYVPLDPAYPAERLRYMLADCGARTVIAPHGVPDGVSAELHPDLLDPRAEADAIAARPATAPRVAVHPQSLAYVIYTSGSTGRPKGVMVAHRGIPNLVRAQAARFGVAQGSRVLQFASFSFDAAVSEIFATLVPGGTLVLAAREELLPGDGLMDLLRRERVSTVTLPPSVLAALPADALPDLRTVVSAGEAADAAVVARWGAGRTLIDAYGPTEATVCATAGVCQPDGGTPSIGRPVEGVRAYVLDGAGEPAPAGVPGELWVGGVGVARGYLGRPALTAEKFVPDPFAGQPGARAYRTGDRARWRADGTLQFLGRVDAQVKVRGFRIEPGEVEAALRRHPGVAGCVVAARRDAGGQTRLVAWIVGPAGAEALRTHLRGALPEYLVPDAFVALERLPVTPNGKVDRAALPAPVFGAAPSSPAPRDAMEARVAEVWREVLGIERVGVYDNFFDLGGTSLLLYRVYSRLREARDDLRVVDLFRHPTVEQLARHLEAPGADGETLARSRSRGQARRAARRGSAG